MKKLLIVLASALLCSGLFAQTVKGWAAYADEPNGGSSTATAKVENGVTVFTGTVTTKYQYGYAGINLGDMNPEFIEALKTAKGIRLTVKGDGKQYSIRVETNDRPDYCFHQFTFTAGSKETTFDIPFAKMTQESWGKQVPLNMKNVKTISIHTVGQPIEKYRLEVVKLEIIR